MFRRIILNIKLHSRETLSAWCYQCESILAQRSRRIQQLFTFYHRVYGTNGLQLILRSYHRQFQPPLRGLVLSAAGAFGISQPGDDRFDWLNERLSLANFDVCQRDIDFINSLGQNEPCTKCKEKSMKYCYCNIGNGHCKKSNDSNNNNNNQTNMKGCYKRYHYGSVDNGRAMINTDSENQWEPYFSKNNFLIWRREEKTHMYSYKVYAQFDDITAADLLHVQTDINYRKQWDDTAVRLELIETDPMPGTNSHLIYWEMRWPRWFCNRDYVYCRRFIWDDTKKVILIGNHGTNHPNFPSYSDKVRVTDYWSLMVIKPYRSFYEPGVHYILTYYDDPGVPIPQNIKSWVTQKQMPDFLKKMYEATKQYACRDAVQMSHIFGTFNLLNNDYKANASRRS